MHKKRYLPYTDVAVESAREQNLPVKAYRRRGLEIKEMEIDYNTSLRVGKKSGYYVTLQTHPSDESSDVVQVLGDSLSKMLKRLGVEQGKILVAGLGNDNYVADALGAKTLAKLAPAKIGKFNLCLLQPSVEGVSGISSFDVVKGVVTTLKPRLVIAVDALVTSLLDRLALCYQLTTAGIAPGGGVGAKLPTLSKSSLGVDTIAVGVPLITSLGAICPECLAPDKQRLQITVKDVDDKVDDCAKIIAAAISHALQKS
ncbi:MAG: GPR endopeptidase [Christensenellales bacterium]